MATVDDRAHIRLVWLIIAILTLACAGLAGSETVATLKNQPLGLDFMPLWTGGGFVPHRLSDLYDFVAVTKAQGWAFAYHADNLRPFVYPPSALLTFIPFSRLPFWPAYSLWLALTGGLFAFAVGRELKGRTGPLLALLLVAPPCVTAALVGQTTFLIGALALLALSSLKTRPVLAGALIAIAVTIKPTALVLVPIALIAGGHWRALMAATAGGVVVVGVTLLLWGLAPWLAWLAATSPFQAYILSHEQLLKGVITPTGWAADLGVSGLGLTALTILCCAAAATLAWITFRRSEDLAIRTAALLGGGLIAAPYAIHYEAALLAPSCILLIASTLAGPRWSQGLIAFVLLIGTGFAHIGALFVLALVALLVSPAWVRKAAAPNRGAGPTATF